MLNQADTDALQQTRDRHGGVLDNYEKDLLKQILKKYGI